MLFMSGRRNFERGGVLTKAGGPNKSSQYYVCNHALDLLKNGVKLKIFQSIFDLQV